MHLCAQTALKLCLLLLLSSGVRTATSSQQNKRITGTVNISLTCPELCHCHGLTVDCSRRGLTTLPSRIPSDTKNLDLSYNHISTFGEVSPFRNQSQLIDLFLGHNLIEYIPHNAFAGLQSLKLLNLVNNNLRDIHPRAFAPLSSLKDLALSNVHKLRVFPDLTGVSALEHLKIDRGELTEIPSTLCEQIPRLKSLIIKSNHISSLPKLKGCHQLRLLDLSYNHITTFGEESAFLNLTKLIDLFLGHNFIKHIPHNAFVGLSSLIVLNLVNNRIADIHPQAFEPLSSLKDLNLGENKFAAMPTLGLQNLTDIKVYRNKYLKQFPPPESFPKVHKLALSYAYHCCAYIGKTHSPSDNSPLLKESFVWLESEDMWNTNITDVWPGYVNFSTKFEEYANQLWKTYGRDYVIPDNLAEYAEQYFEDYKQSLNADGYAGASYPVQCLPKPGPFMPCKDLFDWWTLRCGVWIVFLLALLGNGVVVIVLMFGRSKIDVPRFLVCNLAMADFFMGIYLGILAIVDASTLGEFRIYAIPWQTSWGCQIAGFLGVFSSELSVYTLAVITMERNYAITHAMHLNKRLSLKHASYIMTVGWSFAFLMALMPLLGISDYRKFAVCLPFEVEDSQWSLAYVVFLIIINGVAFLVLMGCYLRMYCAIRGSQAWNSNDSRIAKRMALLVFTDFLCWAPIAFFSLTAVSGYQLISLEEAKVFTIFILPLNSCANPFLYAIFTKQFKKDCVLLCKRIEESRVTRGIGRCRHSSNFSNRHTPANTNSAVEPKSVGSDQLPHLICQCRMHKPKVPPLEGARLITNQKVFYGWKERAIGWISFYKKKSATKSNTGAINTSSQTQKTNVRTSSISSENFSSRSDSWRQVNIPMKVMEKSNQARISSAQNYARIRRNSWNVTPKASNDSSQSGSRQDSVCRVSRLSVSSDSSSKQTTSSSLSSGPNTSAGPSGITKQDVPLKLVGRYGAADKPVLCRQLAIDEKKFSHQNTPVNQTHGYLCHSCSRKEVLQSAATNSNLPKNITFKNKELEEKFNCFYNRLVIETSQDESSEAHDPAMVSTDQSTGGDNKLDLSTNSKDTADTSLQDSISFHGSEEMHPTRTPQPSIEIDTLSPYDDDHKRTASSIGSSAHSVNTAIHLSRETIQDRNKLLISSDSINKTHSMTNIGCAAGEESQLSGRKVASDNSLKRLSIRNLPSLLRSLSSQSTLFFNKKRFKVSNSGRTHPYHMSADNMTAINATEASFSYDAIYSHTDSDSRNRAPPATPEVCAYESSAHSVDKKIIEGSVEENERLIDDCNKTAVDVIVIKQPLEPCSSVSTNDDEVPLI